MIDHMTRISLLKALHLVNSLYFVQYLFVAQHNYCSIRAKILLTIDFVCVIILWCEKQDVM